MNISIIGTGNLAWHLSQALEQAGYRIAEIYGRDVAKAIHLAGLLYSAEVKNDLDFSESNSQLFIIAVSDDAVLGVCAKMLLPENAIVVHTSGAKYLSEMQQAFQIHHDLPVNCGVFYPLMTFTKNRRIDFAHIPLCIEAADEKTEAFLVKVGSAMSDAIYLINSEERRALHVAAVFACNFTNHLWGLAKEIVESEDIEFDILKPLISETFNKAILATHPADVQTGPAVRGDQATVKKHLEYLADDDDLRKVYQTMTDSIRDWHGE
jgi:predicted short-subunit dehydrogenase-like oxidoreductase (DUF2520 family)